MLVAKLVQFALSPFGKAAMIILALAAWTTYQRQDAAGIARERVTLAYEKARVIEVDRQRAIGEAAIKAAEKRAVAAESKIAEFQGLADALSSELQATGKTCLIDDSVRKRLLAIH